MRADGLSTTLGANNPQYGIAGGKTRQPVNAIAPANKGSLPNAKSKSAILRGLLSSREAASSRAGGAGRSAFRPVTRESSVSTATVPTEGRTFSAVPNRSTGFTAGKTNVRPASEMSSPAFTGANSQVGRAKSPLSAPQFRGTQNFEAPGTEETPDALAAGRKSQQKQSSGGSGMPIGPFGRRNGTGVRAPRFQNAGGDDQSTR